MKIGELARLTGLTASRIRFYESAGLLQMVDRQPNGYRHYPKDAQVALELIDTAQKAGFSLEAIRTLLPANLRNWDHGALVAALRGKIADIEVLEKRLAASKARLRAVLDDVEAKPADMSCADNAERVLSRIVIGGEDPTTVELAPKQRESV